MSDEQPTRDEQRAELLASLAQHHDGGRPVPCLSVPPADRGYWTSEHPDEQQLAASLCRHCPAVEPCREYGAAWPKEWGVYGGATDYDRRARVGQRQRKAS